MMAVSVNRIKEQLEDGDRFYDTLDDNVIGTPDHRNKQQGDVRRPVGIPYALGEPSPLLETIFKCTLGFQVVLHNPRHPFVENSDFFSIKSSSLFLPQKYPWVREKGLFSFSMSQIRSLPCYMCKT